MKTHVVEVNSDDFNLIKDDIKKFDIRENNSCFCVNDFLLFNETEDGELTGSKVLRKINYISDSEQKDNFIVMSLEVIPLSCANFLNLTEKEKNVFESIVSHIYLYGLKERDIINTFWDIIEELLGDRDLSEEDIKWYNDYFRED